MKLRRRGNQLTHRSARLCTWKTTGENDAKRFTHVHAIRLGRVLSCVFYKGYWIVWEMLQLYVASWFRLG